MKIKKELPQFENEKALLIAGSLHRAKFYLAASGNIDLIAEFKLPKPTYTDREGHFATRSGQKTLGAGAVYENKKYYQATKFKNTLIEKTRQEIKKHRVNKMYLFCPSYARSMIEDGLSGDLARYFEYVFEGIYVKSHPLELLEKVKEENKKFAGEKAPRRREVERFLKRTEPFAKSGKSPGK